MTPKFTAEQFIDAIYDECYKKGIRAKNDTKIDLKLVQELLGADDREIYLLLNCIDDRIRLRTNLEEIASQKRFKMMNHPCLPVFLDFYLEFYREPLEGQDYYDKEHFKGDNELDYEQYKQEKIANFPQAISNLTVRLAELERFAKYNPNLFSPLGEHFDFSKISVEYMMKERLEKEQRIPAKLARPKGRPVDDERREKSLKAAALACQEVLSSKARTNFSDFEKLCNLKMKGLMIQSGEKRKDKNQAQFEAIKIAWNQIPNYLKGKRHKKIKTDGYE